MRRGKGKRTREVFLRLCTRTEMPCGKCHPIEGIRCLPLCGREELPPEESPLPTLRCSKMLCRSTQMFRTIISRYAQKSLCLFCVCVVNERITQKVVPLHAIRKSHGIRFIVMPPKILHRGWKQPSQTVMERDALRMAFLLQMQQDFRNLLHVCS